jgi:protein-tyrosine phosphatase
MDMAAGMRPGLDRAVRWEGFHNARDLGGLPTATGASTRYGQLIRSADTRFITAAGWEAARSAGIRVVIDLRNADEVVPGSLPAATLGAGTFAVPVARATAARPADIQTMLMPLDDIEDLGLWRRLNGEGLNGTPLYYRPFLDAKPERIAAAFTAIARVPDGGVIFHCGAGRDRTGLISLMLLSLAGVTPEAIVADYELTFGQLALLYAALGLEHGEWDVGEYLKSRGTTVSETITGLVRDVDVAEYLAAAGVSGADMDAFAQAPAMTAPRSNATAGTAKARATGRSRRSAPASWSRRAGRGQSSGGTHRAPPRSARARSGPGRRA